MLASLISYRPNRKKVSSSSTKSPFSLKRTGPASPYASQVFDIGESSYDESLRDTTSFSGPSEAPLPPPPGAEAVVSPRVEVDIDFTPADWFPSHFLKTDSVAGPSSLSHAATVVASSASKSVDTLPTTEAGSDDADGDDYEEDEEISSAEDFVTNLEAMDASDFGHLTEAEELLEQSTSFLSVPPRKRAPSPIKIPNASLHGPRVQLVRTAESSRRESTFSFDGTSAVSGTTLARALIGDTFALSTDRSRYRSGASILTRSDSATLPHGEHPFSPVWSIRKSGAFTPGDAEGGVPPVPTMPEQLRRAIAESRDRAKMDDAAGNKTRRRSGSDAETPLTPLALARKKSKSSSWTPTDDVRSSKRVSRIEEAPTPASTAPVSPELSSLPNSAATTQSPDTSNFHNGVSPSAFPTSPGQSSASETHSSRDIENVLDYYNFDESPDFAGGIGGGGSGFEPSTPDVAGDPSRYKPMFSPITEESGSQLSPNSFRSKRGKMSLTSSPTPSTASARVEWRPETREIRSLPPHPLLPIGERRRSTTNAPAIVVPHPLVLPTSASYPTLPSPSAQDESGHHGLGALEPPSRSIFNRQRSATAPSPIKVVRDSRDITAYNITVTPHGGPPSAGTSPVSPESDDSGQPQTFPETPSAFSPTFASSAGTDRSSMIPPALPSGARAGFSSLAQQVLLTRAATTVRGARHSRMASVTRMHNRSTTIFPSGETARVLKDALLEDGLVSPEEAASETDRPAVAEETGEKPLVEEALQASQMSPATTEPPDTASMYTPSVQSFPSPRAQNRSLHRLSQSDDSHWQPLSDDGVYDYQKKPLPAMPVSPVPTVEVEAPTEATVEVVKELASSSTTSLPRPSTPSPSQPPQPPSRRSSYKSTALPSPPDAAEEVLPAPPASPPSVQEIPVPQTRPTSQVNHPPLLITPADPFLGSSQIISAPTPAGRRPDSPDTSGFASPPPYYTLLYERDASRDNERMTPSTGASSSYPDHHPLSTPGPLREQRSLSIQSLAASPGPNSRRARPRPPLPVGPRRPSASAPMAPMVRDRNGSVSSITSNMQSGRRLASSPRFQTPPLKWRGYTMDAAKWTFSSTQLQSIVSRAIRHSAEASSIRLLRLETVDKDIPEELHRLEMQRIDVKTRYKMLTRRRATLFTTLTSHLDGTDLEDPTYILRVAENLKELSTELDRLAEELHSADEQIAQLTSLRDIHSASALAMALRKLNASFMKQIAEADVLRLQVESLQAERDEAWTQAVDVANDYDDLNERMETNSQPSPGPSSYNYNKRSSRVLAVKKSSIRVSKAGLRSSSSRRSSVSSYNGHRISSSSGHQSATPEDIPPVPPMPRRRPEDIRTDLSTRTSALCTTPTSETRALDRAQDELYSMLGLTVPEKQPRRSRSVLLSAASDSENPILSSLPRSRHRSDASRPSSLPGNSTLSEVLNAMTADRNAMLATLGMLDD
ncbi:hypothetical protein B0H15DRAFT_149689 [Mycena belliarum]|uniref:Uncharacterized protein n=1 Tax=Mycena belliarum TaxID=1033014 RepID=A0AAD6UAH7_9AGAR|nr:hypothetical protein B0H15DRAFT_149689 [Mycena belliae]